MALNVPGIRVDQVSTILYHPAGRYNYLRLASIAIVLYASCFIVLLQYQQGIYEQEIRTMEQQSLIMVKMVQHKKPWFHKGS